MSEGGIYSCGFDVACCGLTGAEDKSRDFDCRTWDVSKLCVLLPGGTLELTIVRLGWEFLTGNELARHDCVWYGREEVVTGLRS